MATRRLPPKLFVVTLRRSFIGRPWWTRETLKGLGFRKRWQKIICKNTPSVVGQLREVKDMIDVKPVVLRTDIKNSPTGKEILLDNGEFFISPETLEELTNDVKLKLK
uniref:Large ribosomal subunit protein uL30m n=1 Tax=Amphimedon queenslandica TaxID=400682 RepID=A0A1X7VFZ2_AMPQE